MILQRTPYGKGANSVKDSCILFNLLGYACVGQDERGKGASGGRHTGYANEGSDGRSMLVTDGIQRARMRCGDHRECLLTPGVPTELEVNLWSTALVFARGHRVRRHVGGSNAPRFEVDPNDGGDLNRPGPGAVAHPVLLAAPGYPSRLELPVLRQSSFPRRRLGEAPVGGP